MESTIAAPPRRSLTIAEFADEARARFGPDITDWAFECPGCGTISAARDFPAECADRLALAAVECIGRHVEDRGCKRVAYSLDPGPWMVTLKSGAVVASFALADALRGPLGSVREIGDTGGPARAEIPSVPLAAPVSAPSDSDPAEPELRPYWTAETGWTDAPGIGCSCHLRAPCSQCESLQECPRCEHEVTVPECDMPAHLAEVHGETTESEA